MPRSIQNLQLKRKFLLMLSLSILLLAPLLVVLYLFILFPTFDAIEKGVVKSNMKRVLDAILDETSHLDNVCYTWTLGYDAGAGRGLSWMKEKAVYRSFASGDFDLLCLVGRDGGIVVLEGYDSATGARRIPSAFSDALSVKKNGILKPGPQGGRRVGIIRTEYGFMITSVRPVFASGRESLLMGHLIMGKFLDRAVMAISDDHSENRFKIVDVNGKLTPSQSSAIEEMRKRKSRISIDNLGESNYIYYLIPDIKGSHSILIEQSFPSVAREAGALVRASLLIGLVSLPVIQYLIWFLLGHYVLKPIDRLKAQVNAIAEGSYTKETMLDRKDEIGMLSHFIDNMAQTIAARNEELKSANTRLETLTITDALTGIYNRRHFDEVLRSEWNRAVRSGLPLSAIMCDVDHFKKYNDMYGHRAGDECLFMAAGALRGVIHRDGDKLFRYGGEEFIAVLPNTPAGAAVNIAHSFLAAVSGLGLKHECSPEYGIVTISAGVASMTPARGADPKRLIELADGALYRSKNDGRNRATYAREEEGGEIVFLTADHA